MNGWRHTSRHGLMYASESAYRGAGLFPFNPQQALRTLLNAEPSVEADRPKTPHQYDIFDRVFINSSPPDGMTLRSANALLTTTINSGGVLSTPVRTYIQKLTVASEQL
ncbi:hypothetical protein GMDG_03504 [Pseudogymnoascus destructans 20631-21]|uniref:Uncharacterized protein n=1 Tax=Pseudogymnoascus destructans (strain ATCC MYA-4855 / 20631-21) TaxID=658429 RepID=L8G6F4_PSED2|nr:hypothetical protein GMDG_03504 [Pseudogymnoascus destructans 20631-21]